jgi:chemotaxis protein methyltransferase CheR
MREVKNNTSTLLDLEYDLLIQAITNQYGYDFSQYSTASFRRRVSSFMISQNVEQVSELIPLLLHNPDLLEIFIHSISVTVTEMFRYPEVYGFFRAKVMPELSSFPRLNIWSAGCATGEEVYSLAIFLEEEDVLDKSQLYATDINRKSLNKAKKGKFSAEEIQLATKNYIQADGGHSFNSYYSASGNGAKLKSRIRKNIIFSHHNLTVDQQFKTMQMVVCRNVLIYFNKDLQDKVLQLFDQTLEYNGILWLGAKETLDFSSIRDKYRVVSDRYKIYQKIAREDIL